LSCPLWQPIRQLTDFLQEHGPDVPPSPAHAQLFGQSSYLPPASPPLPGRFPGTPPPSFVAIPPLATPQPPLKRRARHQHGTSHVGLKPFLNSLDYLVSGSPKRRRVSAETSKPISPSKGSRKKRKRKSGNSPAGDLEVRVKIHLPRRSLPIPSAPTSDSVSSPSTPPSPLSPVGATPTRGVPLSLVANNGKRYHLPPPIPSTNVPSLVVIGRKHPAPPEFDEDVSMPHRKRYITGWKSEYIRLHAPSWRQMLRARQKAMWRPFRPQVIPYLAPPPPSAPPTALRYSANPTAGNLPVETPARESLCSSYNYPFQILMIL